MNRCYDCGFCECLHLLSQDQIKGLSGICAENPKSPMGINDVSVNTECRKFISRRQGWELRDFHEWRDRYVTMKMTRQLAIFSLCISVGVGAFSAFYPSYLSQLQYQASQRADLSFLGSQPTWEVGPDYCTFNVSGQIRNEGARATEVKRIEITVSFPNGTNDVVFWNAKEPSALGWPNSTILEKEIRYFSISMTVPYSAYGFLPYQLPDKGSIKILHNDGIAAQEKVLDFPFER